MKATRNEVDFSQFPDSAGHFGRFGGRFVAETWSDAAGAYAFEGLDLTQRYSVVAYDYAANYRAVIADNIQPEQMA